MAATSKEMELTLLSSQSEEALFAQAKRFAVGEGVAKDITLAGMYYAQAMMFYKGWSFSFRYDKPLQEIAQGSGASNPYVLFALGVLNLRKKNLDIAEEYLLKAHALQPKEPVFMRTMGYLYSDEYRNKTIQRDGEYYKVNPYQWLERRWCFLAALYGDDTAMCHFVHQEKTYQTYICNYTTLFSTSSYTRSRLADLRKSKDTLRVLLSREMTDWQLVRVAINPCDKLFDQPFGAVYRFIIRYEVCEGFHKPSVAALHKAINKKINIVQNEYLLVAQIQETLIKISENRTTSTTSHSSAIATPEQQKKYDEAKNQQLAELEKVFIEKTQQTPLQWTLTQGHLDLAEKLIGVGVNLAPFPDGTTPWDLAEKHNYLTLMSLLRQEAHRLIMARKSNQDAEDLNAPLFSRNESALLTLLRMGHETLAIELSNKATWEETNEEGETAFHIAAKYNCLGVLREREMLFFNKRDQQSKDGFTAFHLAAAAGHLDVLYMLLNVSAGAPANPLLPNHRGSTPLHGAAASDKAQVCKYLLSLPDYQGHIDIKTPAGHTPLYFAAAYVARQACLALLRAGANVNELTATKAINTLSLRILQEEIIELGRILLLNGADPAMMKWRAKPPIVIDEVAPLFKEEHCQANLTIYKAIKNLCSTIEERQTLETLKRVIVAHPSYPLFVIVKAFMVTDIYQQGVAASRNQRSTWVQGFSADKRSELEKIVEGLLSNEDEALVVAENFTASCQSTVIAAATSIPLEGVMERKEYQFIFISAEKWSSLGSAPSETWLPENIFVEGYSIQFITPEEWSDISSRIATQGLNTKTKDGWSSITGIYPKTLYIKQAEDRFEYQCISYKPDGQFEFDVIIKSGIISYQELGLKVGEEVTPTVLTLRRIQILEKAFEQGNIFSEDVLTIRCKVFGVEQPYVSGFYDTRGIANRLLGNHLTSYQKRCIMGSLLKHNLIKREWVTSFDEEPRLSVASTSISSSSLPILHRRIVEACKTTFTENEQASSVERLLFGYHTDPLTVDDAHNTLWHLAAIYGLPIERLLLDTPLCRYILEPNRWGNTAFSELAAQGSVEKMVYFYSPEFLSHFLSQGIPEEILCAMRTIPNYRGDTPLHRAAYYGHKNVCDYLLRFPDVEIDRENIFKETPLALAVKQGHVTVAHLLLRHGAKPGWSEEGLSKKILDLIQLLKQGSDAAIKKIEEKIKNMDDQFPKKIALDALKKHIQANPHRPVLVIVIAFKTTEIYKNAVQPKGNSFFSSKDTELEEFIDNLIYGLDKLFYKENLCRAQDNSFIAPQKPSVSAIISSQEKLHYRHPESEQKSSELQPEPLLGSYAVGPSTSSACFLPPPLSDNSLTPEDPLYLHQEIKSNKPRTEALATTVKKPGWDLCCVDEQGETLLHVVARYNPIDAGPSLLLTLLATPLSQYLTEENRYGNTAFATAAAHGHVTVMEALCEHQDPHQRLSMLSRTNNRGDTPLHRAAQYGKKGACIFLLKRGVAITANHAGETPLHLAVRAKQWDVVRLLLLHDANPYEKNNEGISAVQLASQLSKNTPFEEMANDNARGAFDVGRQITSLNKLPLEEERSAIKIQLCALGLFFTEENTVYYPIMYNINCFRETPSFLKFKEDYPTSSFIQFVDSLSQNSKNYREHYAEKVALQLPPQSMSLSLDREIDDGRPTSSM
jgi:ankyrin repeat protein